MSEEIFMAKIILDAGHGGTDTGVIYNGRQEKDDALKLANAVGALLEEKGIEVVYTRSEDVYRTPIERASIANDEQADYYISLHRNSSPVENQYSGVESLIYDDSGTKADKADDINGELEEVGFKNQGVKVRPGLVVLKRTKMPAVWVEVGFMNSDEDNLIFDSRFDDIAQAIVNGIMESLDEASSQPTYYRVQTGTFRRKDNAERLLGQLQSQGFPAFIINEDGYYKVQVGAFELLDNAIRMEATLRRYGYPTFLTT